MITTRKIKVTITSDNRDEAYEFIRDEMRNQNLALNTAMNHLYFNHIAREKMKLADDAHMKKIQEEMNRIKKTKEAIKKAKTDEKKEELTERLRKQRERLNKKQKKRNQELFDQFTQIIGDSEQTSVRDVISSQFDLKSDTKDCLVKKVYQDFNNDIKNGLLKGERSLRTYSKDNPLYIRGRSLKLYEKDGDFYFKWINKIEFKCILRSKGQNKTELYKTLTRVLEGDVSICDSSIEFDRKKRLILNLSLDMPLSFVKSTIPGRVVGVDLGLKVPAYVALSDDSNPRKAIGSIDDFLRVRTSIQKRVRHLQHALVTVRGGKGRDKKLKALDRFREKERNFATNYNHYLSREIVNFAKKYKAEQINLEYLRMAETTKKSVLRNWSYYQLQQFIEYKAAREGIEVKYVDPYHTSQTCSNCGHYEEGQRVTQAQFKCIQCGYEANADYNAARNIAMSTQFINSKEESQYYQRQAK